mgnify:CR=1 FL=1
MQAINVSIDVDKRLWQQDLAGSKAHCAMLAKQGIISSEDSQIILNGLETITGEIEAGTFPFRAEFEDIHMNVEARLRELIGATAGRLHTARSRNDQVATDFRLWVRDQVDITIQQLHDLQGALLKRAEDYADALNQPVDQPAPLPADGLPPAFYEFVDGLRQDGDIIIHKRNWGAFHGTDLDLHLRRRGIQTIVLAGIASNIGVESTARDAWERNYDLIVVEDACTTNAAEAHAASFKYIFPRISRVVKAAEVTLG